MIYTSKDSERSTSALSLSLFFDRHLNVVHIFPIYHLDGHSAPHLLHETKMLSTELESKPEIFYSYPYKNIHSYTYYLVPTNILL